MGRFDKLDVYELRILAKSKADALSGQVSRLLVGLSPISDFDGVDRTMAEIAELVQLLRRAADDASH